MRGKLLLFGDHAVLYDRPCLVAAIDCYVTVALTESIGRESVFVAATRRLFEQKYGPVKFGFKINGFSSRYGLGSSAAVTVVVAKTCFELKKIKISKQKLFDFCYRVVQQVQGVGSGFDLAAAIYGGVVYFVTGGKKIERLKVKQLPLVVGYSGIKADTVTMIKKAIVSQSFLKKSEGIVNQARRALEKKDWLTAGKLMNQNHEILVQIGVSTPRLNAMVDGANRAGAYGAKLSGAGGGDCMIALVSSVCRPAVERAIRQAGGEIIKAKVAL